MDGLVKLIENIYAVYKKYKLIILILSILGAFLIGSCMIAPFIDSEIYRWIKIQIKANKLISLLVDPEDMFVKAFISSTVPMFFAWGTLLLIYNSHKDKIEQINKVAKYFSWLTKGTSFLVLMLGFAIIGTACYGFFKYGNQPSFVFVIVVGAVFVFLGLMYRASGKLHLEQSKILDKSAFWVGLLCLCLSFSAYIYGIVSGPLDLWLAVKNTYNQVDKQESGSK